MGELPDLTPDDKRPESPTLAPGQTRSYDFTAQGRLLTSVGGSLGTTVLSTPGMIAMMERCSALHAWDNLPPGQATVGFEVCIRHVGAAKQGAPCSVTATLSQIVDSRKLRYDVEVSSEGRTIGTGTHERRVVDASSHGE